MALTLLWGSPLCKSIYDTLYRSVSVALCAMLTNAQKKETIMNDKRCIRTLFGAKIAFLIQLCKQKGYRLAT